MFDAKGISTPLPSGVKISKIGFDYMDDLSLYHSIVGDLQYVTITRARVGYNVNKVCQFMAQSLLEHWKTIKHILCYHKGILTYGLQLQTISSFQNHYSITTFCDAD